MRESINDSFTRSPSIPIREETPSRTTYENHDLIDKHELIQLREYDAIEVIVIDEDSKGRKREKRKEEEIYQQE